MDSRNSCRAIATEQLKRSLLEELGTYVESKAVVKDSLLDKDEITTLTAGVVQVVVMDEKWDGKVYWLKAQVKADPDEVAASIDKLKNDEHLVHDLEEARVEATQAMEEAEALRQQLAQATADKQKQEQYNEAMNQLIAADYFDIPMHILPAKASRRPRALFSFLESLNAGYVEHPITARRSGIHYALITFCKYLIYTCSSIYQLLCTLTNKD